MVGGAGRRLSSSRLNADDSGLAARAVAQAAASCSACLMHLPYDIEAYGAAMSQTGLNAQKGSTIRGSDVARYRLCAGSFIVSQSWVNDEGKRSCSLTTGDKALDGHGDAVHSRPGTGSASQPGREAAMGSADAVASPPQSGFLHLGHAELGAGF